MAEGGPELSIRLFSLFGGVELLVNGMPPERQFERDADKLLALLVLRRGGPAEREWLAGQLWPDIDRGKGLAKLRRALGYLRIILGEQKSRVKVLPESRLLLSLNGVEVDVVDFDAAVQRDFANSAESSLKRAVELHRRPLLWMWTDAWVAEERDERASLYRRALEILATSALARSDYPLAIHYGEKARTSDPLWEPAVRLLMRAYAGNGEWPKGIMVYRDFRAQILEMASVEPDPDTQALFDRLLREQKAQAEALAQAVRSARTVLFTRGNLPEPTPHFLGRSDELPDVIVGLNSSGVVTLTGPGGIGKTQLAIHVGKEIEGTEGCRDGVWFVDLDTVEAGDQLPRAVANALGMPAAGKVEDIEQLVPFLDGKELMLVLDTCDRLIQPCGDVIAALRRASKHLRILCTSRRVLDAVGEIAIAVPPLAVPDHEKVSTMSVEELLTYDAVRLFVSLAPAIPKRLELTQENAAAVARICERLDGIPLALELAAAQLPSLSPARLADALARDDRFPLLDQGKRKAQARHRNLKAMVNFSYEQLRPKEQAVFTRLSVFRGGASLPAATSVCGPPWPPECAAAGEQAQRTRGSQSAPQSETLTSSFAPASLSLQPHSFTAGEWEILRILSQLVTQSMVQYEASKDRYRLLETLREYGERQLQGLGEKPEIERRHATFFRDRAAAVEPKLIGPQQLWAVNELSVEHNNLRKALDWAVQTGATELGLELGGTTAEFWDTQGYYTEGRQRLKSLLGLRYVLQYPGARSRVLRGLGALAYKQGDRSAAREALAEALKIAELLQDRILVAGSLNVLGNVEQAEENYGLALDCFDRSSGLFQELGRYAQLATVYANTANLMKDQQRYDEALTLHEQALQLRRDHGSESDVANSLLNIGVVHGHQEEYALAEAYIMQALPLSQQGKDPSLEATCWRNLGYGAHRQGDYGQATRCYENAGVICRELGQHHRLVLLCCNQGLLALDQNDFQTALSHYREALAYYGKHGPASGVADCLDHLGGIAAAQADGVRAARLLGAAEGRWGERSRSPDLLTYQDRYLSDARKLLGDERFQAEWKKGRAASLSEILRYALGGADLN